MKADKAKKLTVKVKEKAAAKRKKEIQKIQFKISNFEKTSKFRLLMKRIKEQVQHNANLGESFVEFTITNYYDLYTVNCTSVSEQEATKQVEKLLMALRNKRYFVKVEYLTFTTYLTIIW